MSAQWSQQDLLVLGSLSSNPLDRHHDADSLRPVQVIRDGAVDPLDVDWPSSLGASTGTTFDGRVVLSSQETIHMDAAVLTGLRDVHELTVEDDTLWIPNTGANDVLSMTLDGKLDRVFLGEGYHHCNQVFTDVSGRRWVLVHHVHGRQLLRRAAGRLVKSQGDGGLLDIESLEPLGLKLSAPHSARVVDGENWILDSGRAQVTRFSADWDVLGHVSLAGWGRGAQLTQDGKMLYVGISPLRHRYKSVSSVPAIAQPEVHVIDVERHRVIERIAVPGMDQINGLLLASLDQVRDALGTTSPSIEVGDGVEVPLVRSSHG